MITQLGKQYNLPTKAAFSAVRGFYVQLYCGDKSSVTPKDLPPVFIKVTQFKNTLNFTTPDLVSSASAMFLFSISLPACVSRGTGINSFSFYFVLYQWFVVSFVRFVCVCGGQPLSL